MTIDQLDLAGTYTYADYLQWTFEERLEIIKGKIFKMSPAPARRHQKISFQISNRIYNYLKGKSCEAYTAPFDVRFTPLKRNAKPNQVYTVVQPDISVICNLEKLDDQGCSGAPDLIIEILSPGNSNKEFKNKFEVYQENGVKEYWLVDSTEKAIFVYVLNEAGVFIGLKPLIEEEILTSSVLPGFEMLVGEIFAE
ncbi:Uma2 family endonuclease [Dyadobacter sp. CY356]|uniref:Uma2 family endonuclease n=1 Tax=Dyadobacter sp. CY356 TaxID=2906442 RepID=UPI001F46C81A|nr:Uma2 family endonuclease [Dyadobacter sp. CY356]MCF0058503.1 Uma2 family endonuclease [Dyadobacter sp. CY356]